ncbi:MAG: hypothetical protein HYR60_32850 [Acidobacteria bacterium]|nr:hypothetical protein [Acidobacteriota bacterium]
MAAEQQPDSRLQKQERIQQAERILESPLLQNSEALQNILRFLVRQSLDSPSSHPKEYQIATEVLGRPADFDPRIDSTVRVQTARLRTKLAEYYATLGSGDRIVLEIPKGSYAVTFRERFPAEAPRPETPEPRRTWTRPPIAFGLAGVAILAGVAAWVFPRSIQRTETPLAGPLVAFWKEFTKGDRSPLVVFSNAEFVGRPETGLRYYNPRTDQGAAPFDHYTGVGEVISVHTLTQLFADLRHRVVLKRGRLLNWDDTKDRNLIFIGSPSENPALRELPLGKEFAFRVMETAPRKGDLGIVNLHPRAGEQPAFLASSGLPIEEDYAVIELARSSGSAHWILLAAGTTTFGTQAGVEFVCRATTVKLLIDRLGSVRPFAAVLRVTVNRGVPLKSEVVALHM